MVARSDATLRLGIGGVLSDRAEAFLKENPDQENALRRLLTLKLAIVPPEGEPVRRQTTREECTEGEWSLAARLAEYPWRLVVIGEREADSRLIAEVAHEALLRAWPRLSDWLRDQRDFLVFKSEAERAESGDRAKWVTRRRRCSQGSTSRGPRNRLPTRGQDLSANVIAFTTTAVSPGATRTTLTAPSPIMTKRSGSSRNWRLPTRGPTIRRSHQRKRLLVRER
jgi:hypothetical protein